MLAVFQQITGINTVIYYAPTLLQGAGFGNSAALLANVVNGAVNVGMTIVAIWLLDRAGRRPLLLSGTAGMAVGMAITACAFLGGEHLHGRWPSSPCSAWRFTPGRSRSGWARCSGC